MRTDRERMLAGEPYRFLDPGLVEEREKARQLLGILNRTESPAEQRILLQRLLGSIGQNSTIEPPFYCTYGRNLHLGDHVYLNVLCTVIDNNEVRIVDHVMIGPGVQIYKAEHPLRAERRREGWEVAKRILIEENVWIGGSAVLLPGITVGRNAVVGAGAVVTRDVPPSTVVAGSPARVIREIEQ